MLIEKIPLLALAAGACGVTALVPGLVIPEAHRLPLFERLGNAVVSYVIYLRQMIFPTGLAMPYPSPANGQPIGQVALALVFLAAITAGVVAWRKKHPCLLMGWLWYLGMLLPVIGIIQILHNVAHADHFTYLPEIGLAIAVTWAVADLNCEMETTAGDFARLMAAVIGTLLVCAHAQTSYWKNDETLWTRALDCTSGNSVAHNNLGLALAKNGDVADAIAQFSEALKIHPDDAEVHYNLGVSLFVKGDFEDAIAQYHTALAIAPDNAVFHNNLGTALYAKGAVEEAIAQFRESAKLQPGYADAHYNLGNALLNLGKLDEAIAQYRSTLDINPAHEQAHYNLGVALFMKGDLAAAVYAIPKSFGTQSQPGQCPEQPGMVSLNQGRIASQRRKSRYLGRNANWSSSGGNPFILQTLAAAYAEKGSYEPALVTARQALNLAVAQRTTRWPQPCNRKFSSARRTSRSGT